MSHTAAQRDLQVKILSDTTFFAALSPAQLALVATTCQVIDCAEEQQIYKIGEKARTLYVLNDGMVRFAISYNSRNAAAGDILRRGQVFGWSALTPSANVRIATASCLTPCSLLAIDGTQLLALMEQDHTMGFRLTTQLTILITGTLTSFVGG